MRRLEPQHQLLDFTSLVDRMPLQVIPFIADQQIPETIELGVRKPATDTFVRQDDLRYVSTVTPLHSTRNSPGII
jgi:hypothetical protein